MGKSADPPVLTPPAAAPTVEEDEKDAAKPAPAPTKKAKKGRKGKAAVEEPNLDEEIDEGEGMAVTKKTPKPNAMGKEGRITKPRLGKSAAKRKATVEELGTDEETDEGEEGMAIEEPSGAGATKKEGSLIVQMKMGKNAGKFKDLVEGAGLDKEREGAMVTETAAGRCSPRAGGKTPANPGFNSEPVDPAPAPPKKAIATKPPAKEHAASQSPKAIQKTAAAEKTKANPGPTQDSAATKRPAKATKPAPPSKGKRKARADADPVAYDLISTIAEVEGAQGFIGESWETLREKIPVGDGGEEGQARKRRKN
ncbi:hypothetical protein K458DRAFT_403214 [Lentithecium fluviatile CBS 122367]|uniref:Uncharacterized protein n=1 Tax=Lentithecium fluviatile CBS 122367 TaxID=1168545 RepID=A0A6G1J6P2_9PLEO|nr:hypothetical protein K458DRAFT_403214 [Lentithecium fluviatile CBS 122367]